MSRIKIVLANGTKLENLVINGTEFVSKTKVDESIFTEEALKEVKVYEGEESIQTYTEAVFIHQQKWEDGYYLAFRELTESEKKDKVIQMLGQKLTESRLDGMKKDKQIQFLGQQLAESRLDSMKKDLFINQLGKGQAENKIAILKLQKGV